MIDLRQHVRNQPYVNVHVGVEDDLAYVPHFVHKVHQFAVLLGRLVVVSVLLFEIAQKEPTVDEIVIAYKFGTGDLVFGLEYRHGDEQISNVFVVLNFIMQR